ncbi:hypothetical protein ACFL35_00245 [Candidatus Riflebacteria bacterium]
MKGTACREMAMLKTKHQEKILQKYLCFLVFFLLTTQCYALEEIQLPGIGGDYRFLLETHQDAQQTGGQFYKNYFNFRSPDWKKEFTWEINGEMRYYNNPGASGSTYRVEEEDKLDTAYIRWAPEADTKFVITAGRQFLTSDYWINMDGIRVHGYPHKNIDACIFGGRKIQYYKGFAEDNIFGGELGLHFDILDFRYHVKKDIDKVLHNLNFNFYLFENFTFLAKEQIFDDRQEYFQLGFDYINKQWDFTVHDLFTQRNVAVSRVATPAGNDAFPSFYPYDARANFLYPNNSISNFFSITKSWSDKFETGMEWELLLDNSETNYWAQFFFSVFDLFTDGSKFTFDINRTAEELINHPDLLTAGFEYQFPFRLHWLFNFGYYQDILDTTGPDSYRWGRIFGGLQYKRNKNYLFKLQVNNHNGDIINNGLFRNAAATKNDNQLNFESIFKF